MTSIGITAISDDLALVVRRVEMTSLLGQDFCDRLTRSLGQLFGIAERACSDQDRASFDRIFIRVAPGATIEARIDLSDRLAGATVPPRRILLLLANDVAEVARPVLIRSPALDEEDLIDIARSRGVGHMGAATSRGSETGQASISVRLQDRRPLNPSFDGP
jgi:hypothetical protein